MTAPLSYADLSQTATTALLGVRLHGQVSEKTSLMASVGLEQDMKHSVDHYSATGVDGITPFAFNTEIKRTRPIVTGGIAYAISPTQTIYAQAQYSQEPFQSSASATGMLMYQLGF